MEYYKIIWKITLKVTIDYVQRILFNYFNFMIAVRYDLFPVYWHTNDHRNWKKMLLTLVVCVINAECEIVTARDR